MSISPKSQRGTENQFGSGNFVFNLTPKIEVAEKRTQNQIDFNKIGLKKPKNSTLDSKENLDVNQNEMSGQEKDPNKDFTNFNLQIGESISQFDHNSVITQRKENDDDRPKILFNNDKESQITRYPQINEQYDY